MLQFLYSWTVATVSIDTANTYVDVVILIPRLCHV